MSDSILPFKLVMSVCHSLGYKFSRCIYLASKKNSERLSVPNNVLQVTKRAVSPEPDAVTGSSMYST